jgi:hypothetical protein
LPRTLNWTLPPTRSDVNSSEGTEASSRMDEGSMIVNIAVPGLTTSPTFTARSETTPVSGARRTASPNCFSAATSRARASASCASTWVTAVRA